MLISLVVFSILISGCGSESSSSQNSSSEASGSNSDSVIKIGVILPLSGNMAVSGEMMKKGIELATEEYNSMNKFPNNSKIELLIYDDRANPSEGVSVAQKLIGENVSAILGPYNSSVALAVKDIISNAQIPFLTVGTAADAMTEGNVDWYFRAHAYNGLQAEKFADFIVNKLGSKRVAFLYSNDDYGKGLSEQVKTFLNEMGAEIVADEAYNPGNRDFSPSLTKIKAKNPDAIATIALGEEAAIIAKQAKTNGIPGNKIVGVGQFDRPDFYELSAGGGEGVYFMFWFDKNNPLVPEAAVFAELYQNKYNQEPDSAAAQSYTAAKVLYEAIISAGSSDRTAIRDALLATELSTPIGLIKFNEKHNADTGVFFAQWKDGNKQFIK